MTDLLIRAVGDVGAKRDDLASMFAGSRALLNAADYSFGQLETVVSDRGAMVPNARLAMRAPSTLAPVLHAAGFDAMSFAGNHCLDWGYEGFGDTLTHMRDAGVAIAGAGPTIEAAIRPVMLRRAGRTIALIAANSILPEGYAASNERPGCAPLRANTLYEQIEHDQPGTPARVHSRAHVADLARLVDSVTAAKREADIVLASLHWGIHMVRGSIADYQVQVARALIDAGADAILGHHPHLMKGIGFYRSRPIFYSLGNFALEQPHVWDPAITQTESFRHLVSLNPQWEMESAYMLPEETRITGIAELRFDGRGLVSTHLRPAWIGDDSVPRIVTAADPQFARIRDYLVEVTNSEGLSTRIVEDGETLQLLNG